jgi:hypothetical protein
MAKANKVTAEQLSTIERLVKPSIIFAAVTQIPFSILVIALPPPPPKIATKYTSCYPLPGLLT